MKLNFIILLLLLVVSCNKKKEKKDISERQIVSDTLIKTSTIIIAYPNENEIDFLKKKHGEEGFYIIADDANYYQYECFGLLDNNKEKYVTSNKQIFKFNNGFVIDKKSYDNKWMIIDYRDINDNPKTYSSIDFTNHEKANKNPIKMLKEFYSTFYFSDEIINNKNLKRKFISERILNRIDSLNSNENELVLDYDPFIKGQDFFGNAIKKTINIKTLKNKNQFRVSFSLFGGENEETTNIDFLLKKNKKGDYLIYSILNDKYLNFKKKRCFYKNIIKNKTICVEKLYNNKTKISIIDIKNDNILQEIDYEPYSFNFECKSSIYDSNVNIHNDYEIVIGDYNFDGLQDFAILNDNTINTGTIFSYFFQNKQGQFYQNKNFPLNLIPSKINNKSKTLTQQNIIGCCKIGTNVYQLKGNIWLNILSEEKDMDKQ